MKEYKITLLGPTKSGKTTFIRRHLLSQHPPPHNYESSKTEEVYAPTIGAEVHPIHLDTNYGKFRLNCWDVGGDKKYDGLFDGYIIGSDAVLVFGGNYHRDVGDIPISYVNAEEDINLPFQHVLRDLTGHKDLTISI